jgi:hypothetical protein
MKNTLGDLQNHLFAQLERLSDEDLTGEDLETELRRSSAISSLASQMIANGNLVLKAMKYTDDSLNADAKLPRLLEG